MDVRRCRFCGEVVSSKHSVGLFTPQANFDNLAARLGLLLQLPVSANDGLSKFTCRLCRGSLENLEAKLAAKRSAVRAVYQRAGYVTGVARISLAQIPPNQGSSTLKRPKDTSGGPGVSPATAKARPPSKRPTVSRTLFPQGTKYLLRNIKYL